MSDDQQQSKCGCGMPLDENTRCTCQPEKCIHCCTCAPDCACGCKQKSAENK